MIKKIKIAFYMTSTLEFGGGLEKYMIDTAYNLSLLSNIEADVITMDQNYTKRIANLLQFYYIKKTDNKNLFNEITSSIISKLGKAKYIKCKSFVELKKVLSKYDVIYSKNEILEAFILKYLSGYRNLPPVIFGCHTPIYYPIAKSFHSKIHNFLYNGFVYKYLTDGVKKFHVINSGDETQLGRLFPKKQIVKIYNPFDFDNFLQNARKFRYIFCWDKSKFNIIWVGRLTEQKGINDLVDIINLINKSEYRKKIIWNICGDGPEKDKILDLKKWQNVNCLGYVDNKYMPSIYKQNSLFISTSHWEGFPYNLLEAQGAGLPVLAYNISGCNDMIDNKVNGILVEDIDQFKSEIINTIDGRYIFPDINKYISQKFNSDAIYRQLINLFISVQNKNN